MRFSVALGSALCSDLAYSMVDGSAAPVACHGVQKIADVAVATSSRRRKEVNIFSTLLTIPRMILTTSGHIRQDRSSAHAVETGKGHVLLNLAYANAY